jgi:hypothetical protein
LRAQGYWREKVTDPNSRNILPLRQATARAPNSDVFGLVQYPHKPHERGNSSNRYQKRECRYLPRGKAVVVWQRCLVVV